MTETEWLVCKDPEAMLSYLTGAQADSSTTAAGTVKMSDRRLRLFAVACCRAVWDTITRPESRAAVLVAQRMADGEVSEAEALEAWRATRHAGELGSGDWREAVRWCLHSDAGLAAQFVSLQARRRGHYHEDGTRFAGLLRDIAGNPFCRVDRGPVWRLLVKDRIQYDWHWSLWEDCLPARLALAIYEEMAWDRLPVLADALEEAGCCEDVILEHLRSPSLHVKGCWCLDLVLGR